MNRVGVRLRGTRPVLAVAKIKTDSPTELRIHAGAARIHDHLSGTTKVFGTIETRLVLVLGSMPATTIDAERAYNEDRFSAQEVFRSDRSKVVCGYFEPGQFIPVHAPDSDVTIVVQSGQGIVREGEHTHDVGPGSVVTVSAGKSRGVRAEDERLEAVLVTAPPPTDAEHAPVRRGLEQGTFDPEPLNE